MSIAHACYTLHNMWQHRAAAACSSTQLVVQNVKASASNQEQYDVTEIAADDADSLKCSDVFVFTH